MFAHLFVVDIWMISRSGLFVELVKPSNMPPVTAVSSAQKATWES